MELKTLSLKVGELISLYQELNKLTQEKVSFVLKYKINKLLSKLEPQIKVIESSRKDLIDQYATIENDHYKFTPENGKAFEEELSSLFEQIESFEYLPLKLSEFEEVKSEYPYNFVFKLVED